MVSFQNSYPSNNTSHLLVLKPAPLGAAPILAAPFLRTKRAEQATCPSSQTATPSALVSKMSFPLLSHVYVWTPFILEAMRP